MEGIPCRDRVFQACVNSRHFFKSVTELILYCQKQKLWSFYIKFGELRYKNVNNTFMVKQNLS